MPVKNKSDKDKLKDKVNNELAGKYILGEKIGEGGNACVYEVEERQDGKRVIKVLRYNKDPEKRRRFIKEINVMIDNKEISGIMPIFEFSPQNVTNSKENKNHLWYVMPKATLITDYLQEILKSESVEERVNIVVGIVIQLTETLEKLHEKGISHRDIKPENIYFYKNRGYLGDFGLAKMSTDTTSYTLSNKPLGPIFTMAPEMRRYPKEADGCKADVYSLAKTFWMLLVFGNKKLEKGFEGPYNTSVKEIGLRWLTDDHEKLIFRGVHLVELEELLIEATKINPDDRPTMKAFREKLKDWKQVTADFQRSEESEWKFLASTLFPYSVSVPRSVVWTDLADIERVLNEISTSPANNHLLFSGRGGLDFYGCEKANEDGCLLFRFQGTDDGFKKYKVARPKALYFEQFRNSDWNYFQLKLDELKPVTDNTSNDGIYEDVVEVGPGKYVTGRYYDYGILDYDSGEKLPPNSKRMERCLRGAFLIVLNPGFYNAINSTYDGRHGDCPNWAFRKYIELLEEVTEQIKLYHPNIRVQDVLNNPILSINPFNLEGSYKRRQLIKLNNDENKFKRKIEDKAQKLLKSKTFKLPEPMAQGQGAFYIEVNDERYSGFNTEDVLSFMPILQPAEKKEQYVLCKDGKFRRLAFDSGKVDFYFCNTYESAMQVKKQIIADMGGDCEKISPILSIQMVRGKLLPKHLFTEFEICCEMIRADDRKSNQLVIDENGCAHVVQIPDVNTANDQRYPVTLKPWGQGSIMTGKYSNLTGAEYHQIYLVALNGWCEYLKTGWPQVDGNPTEELGASEQDLISKIKEFY